MYLLQAARDADGEGRRRRSPSSCLVCAESPEMLEMKLGLSISSGLIAYLPGWASASKTSSLSLSLFGSHCLACTLAGLMKYLLTALFDQLATGLLMSRALHQATGGAGGGAAPPWTLRKYLLSKLHFTCVCALCSYFIYVYVQKSIRSETVRAGYEKSFYAFFPAAKSIFKLFPPPTRCLGTFICHNMVRSYVIPLPARTQEILKRNSIWVARVCPGATHAPSISMPYAINGHIWIINRVIDAQLAGTRSRPFSLSDFMFPSSSALLFENSYHKFAILRLQLITFIFGKCEGRKAI